MTVKITADNQNYNRAVLLANAIRKAIDGLRVDDMSLLASDEWDEGGDFYTRLLRFEVIGK